MRPRLWAVAALFVLLGAMTAGPAPAEAARYYVALGDSLARSSQPNGNFQQGYAEQLLALRRQQDPSLRLVKLACGGATTTDMIGGSDDRSCAFPRRTQLAEAEAFLRAHRKFVSLVTIDIGGNDLPDLDAIARNLPVILDRLRRAAGDGVPIVGMTYYEPCVVPAWFGFDFGAVCDGAGPTVADAVSRSTAFNDLLEGIYETDPDDGAAPYADVEGAFEVTDMTPDADVDVDGTPEPRNVVRACQWTWMCFGPPLGPDLHANTAGYGVIAGAFMTALSPQEGSR